MKGSVISIGFAVSATLLGGTAIASAQVMDEEIYVFAGTDEFEYAPGLEEGLRYDASSWIGGDYTRIWLKAEGEHLVGTGGGETGIEVLYSRLVSPFWELQTGIRMEALYGDEGDEARGLLAMGFEGLAPYWFEVESFLYVSQDGDVSADLEVSYELLLTQRLIAEPELEASVVFQDVEEFGIATGVNGLELGLRLRYEIVREFAPYVGVAWKRLLGDTADLAREEGEPVSDASLVAGLRMWY